MLKEYRNISERLAGLYELEAIGIGNEIDLVVAIIMSHYQQAFIWVFPNNKNSSIRTAQRTNGDKVDSLVDGDSIKN